MENKGGVMQERKRIAEHKILQLATYAGKLVLINGGEIYRVENAVVYIGNKFGIEIDSFATLTCIISSVKNPDGETFTAIERIKSRSNNLDKINQVQTILDNIDDYKFEELKTILKAIEKEKAYPLKLNILAGAIGSSGFVVLSHGNINEFIVSFLSGGVVMLFEHYLKKLSVNSFFTNLILGGICSFVSTFFYINKIIPSLSISTISTLMLLVPGVSFINAIRDIINGDLVAGTSRVMEVFMIGSSIALGAVIATNILSHFGGDLCFL